MPQERSNFPYPGSGLVPLPVFSRLKGRPRLALRGVQKFRHLHDADSAMLPQAQQILVPRDDALRLALDRAFEDAVIVRILFHDVEPLRGLDALSEASHRLNDLLDAIFRPFEALAQRARDFLDDVVGD